jgi:hypothetical protein
LLLILDNFGNIGKWLEFDENTIKVGNSQKFEGNKLELKIIIHQCVFSQNFEIE